MEDRFGEQTAAEAADSLCRIAVTTIAVGALGGEITREHLNAARGWTAGPLPLAIDSPFRPRVTSDLRGRQSYHESHLREVVLGSGPRSWRAHQFLVTPIKPRAGVRIWAVEAVGMEAMSAVLVHGTIDPSGMSLVEVHEAMGAVDLSALDFQHRVNLIDSPQRRDEQERFRLCLITKRDANLPRLTAAEHLTRRDRHWAHAFASRTLPREHFPSSASAEVTGRRPDFDADDESLVEALPEGTWFAPSSDWRLGVLQVGAAFIGTRPDTRTHELWSTDPNDRSDGEFFDFAELYVRTIHADTVLLAMLQRQALERLSETAREMAQHQGAIQLSRLEDLETQLAKFQETVWSERASGGGVTDSLLSGYQLQHRLPEQLAQVSRNVESLSRRARLGVETSKAGALFVLSALGAFGLALTVTRSITEPPAGANWTTAIWALVISIAVTAALLFLLARVFPGLRSTISAALRQRTRSRRTPTRDT